MTTLDSNMTGFVLNMTGFVLNTTGFFNKKIVNCPEYNLIFSENYVTCSKHHWYILNVTELVISRTNLLTK